MLRSAWTARELDCELCQDRGESAHVVDLGGAHEAPNREERSLVSMDYSVMSGDVKNEWTAGRPNAGRRGRVAHDVVRRDTPEVAVFFHSGLTQAPVTLRPGRARSNVNVRASARKTVPVLCLHGRTPPRSRGDDNS